MGKFKHEKELARDKKKKDLRRRVETRRQAMASAVAEIVREDCDIENLSVKSVAMTIHTSLDTPYVPKPSSTWLRLKGMLSKDMTRIVEDLAHAGALLRQDAPLPLGPPPINVVLVQGSNGLVRRCNPISKLIQRCRGYTSDVAADLIDLYHDSEIVLMVTTMTGFPHQLVVGRARNGEEFAAVVHNAEWHHLADSKMARRFLMKEDLIECLARTDSLPELDPHVFTMERMRDFQARKDLTIPGVFEGKGKVDAELCKQVIDDTESVIMASSTSTSLHLVRLAEILGREKRLFDSKSLALEEKFLEVVSTVNQRFAEIDKSAAVHTWPARSAETIVESAPAVAAAAVAPKVEVPKSTPSVQPRPRLKDKLAALLVLA